MKYLELRTTVFVFICLILLSCGTKTEEKISDPASKPIVGTWRLLTGTLIEKGDTTLTDYTGNISFIKIINDTHFAFLQHDKVNKDSAFSAGGGSYSFKDSSYTEHLQYCSARQWEGSDFNFTINIKNDTLTQYGIEDVEKAGIKRLNIEKYVKVKE